MPRSIEEIERQLIGYCQDAIGDGYEISECGAYLDPGLKQCCAIGAVMLAIGSESTHDVASHLAIDWNWVCDISSAFEGWDPILDSDDKEMSALGTRLRARYIDNAPDGAK